MSVKVLHTSDWHLGKKLFKKSRLPEQKLFLDWLITQIQTLKIDILLISGDIFDIPNPPNDATSLYFHFLSEISEKTSCYVMIIPGNHDSSSFLQAPCEILKKHNIHVICGIEDYKKNNHILLNHLHHKICIKALPYFRSFELYNELNKSSSETIVSQDVELYLKAFFQYWPHEAQEDCFKIIMSHHAFGPFETAGSEQALMLSGLESIPLNWIREDFDYMALGHIHKPQKVSSTLPIYYCGSPIPLRFSEKNNKILNLIEYDKDKQQTNITALQIPIFREVIQIKGNKDNIFDIINKHHQDLNHTGLRPFVEIQLDLATPDNQFTDEIFDYCKNIELEVLSFIPIYYEKQNRERAEITQISQNSIGELFKKFYAKKYPKQQDIPPELLELFLENFEEIKNEDNQTSD
jgi:DNA repair protein SbcD/Mre11